MTFLEKDEVFFLFFFFNFVMLCEMLRREQRKALEPPW